MTIQIDCDFPGGNIIVDRIDGDHVFWRQDQRDTTSHFWFYWYARIRGAAGRNLTFHFTDGDCLTNRGPAVSTDGGATWNWLGSKPGPGLFAYSFPADADDVRFCLAEPYLEPDWRRFVARWQASPHFAAATLCQTEKGRQAELARVGRLDGSAPLRLAMTCRHHCCEMMASFAVEGFIEAVLTDNPAGRWFRDNVELLVIPFADKDGVEQGDQGKLRHPRDHGADYAGDSIHATVRAIKQFVTQWSVGRLKIGLDMHCPGHRGKDHENIFFVGSPNQENWRRVGRLSQVLCRVQAGPLVFDPRHNLPHGQSWNTYAGPPRGFSTWVQTVPGVHLGSGVELPYAVANDGVVTGASARLFGRDLAVAVIAYLQSEPLDPLPPDPLTRA